MSKSCSRCGEQKPATREFFGSTPSGGLRGDCRTCMNMDSRDYEVNNKQRRLERDSQKSTSRKRARGGFSLATKKALHVKQSGICPCCMKPIGLASDGEVDHMTPLSKGGKHDSSNFMLAHKQRNKEKHNKTLLEHWDWRVERGLDTENLGRKHGLF